MKERTAWSATVAVALLSWAAGSPPCRSAPPDSVHPAQRAAPPAVRPDTPPEGPKPLALPAAVSSDVARFVRQSGRDAAPEPTPAPTSTELARMRAPSIFPARRSPAALGSVDNDRAGAAPPPAPAPGAGGAPITPPSPLATTPRLDAAPFDPADVRFPINLATALRLSDARPLIVAMAQARAWVAEAELTQAKLLWVPDLNVGFDYLRHDGGGPDFNKGIMTAPSVNFFYGGAGLYGFVNATDAIFQPLVARQVLNARHWDIQTAKNDALLQTADAYFRVHQSRGTYTGALYTVARGQDVLDRVVRLSRDLVSEFEVDRARNMLADLEQQSVSARQQWRVHSATLTKVLRLDPRAVVEPLEHDHTQITLIDPARELDDLMPIALTNRPELAARQALVEAAAARIRREKARPLLPVVLLNGYQTPGGMLLQAGIFSIGPNSSLNQWRGRDDVSIQMTWQLQNFGFGNLAQIKAQRGLESQAIVDLRRTQDTVAEEVNQAHARLQSAAARIVQADRALRTGIITLNGTIEGLGQTSRFGDVLVLITRPQEAIYALQLLKQAFDEYFSTVADYNRAQFELFHALGYPAHEVSQLRPPGELLQVDTARPLYLPPVGNGPPPATR